MTVIVEISATEAPELPEKCELNACDNTYDDIPEHSKKAEAEADADAEEETTAAVAVEHKIQNKQQIKQQTSMLEPMYKLVGINNVSASQEIGTLILLGVMAVLFIMSVTGFFVMWFTEYYNNAMFSKIILKEHSETANDWINPAPKYDTLLKVHIFNYTNINEFVAGKERKIKVQDIGPLVYKEHTRKVNVTFNKNYTVSFRDNRSYQFLADKSTINETDMFYFPNVPLWSAAIKLENMGPAKRMGAIALINTFKEPTFKMLSAQDLLWGYRDHIISLDFAGGLTHFGLLRTRNGTSVDSLQINTGEDDIQKFSTIRQFNGAPLLDFWSDEHCNRIDGSDATMFPPHLLAQRAELQVFLQVLCRKVPLRFEKEVTILNNIDVFRYRTPMDVFDDPEKNPENQCYCHNTARCLPSGVINATKCYNGAPIYPSFPHFFSGDPIIYKDFEGIKPNATLHQTYADIHPRFAFPISGASRIQINIAVQKGTLLRGRVNRLKDGTILPLIWIEITSGDFTDDIIEKLYVSTFGLDAIQTALKYGTLLTCIASFSLIVAGYYYLLKKNEELYLKEQANKLTELEPFA